MDRIVLMEIASAESQDDVFTKCKSFTVLTGGMMKIRERFLPQGWYPDSEKTCRREISDFDDYISRFTLSLDKVCGGIIPHAGWFFSGRLAALIFKTASDHLNPDIVVIFGGHLGPGRGVIYDDHAWSTPLGHVYMDVELTRALTDRIALRTEGSATNDNTVEIQLPLVKYFFPESKLLALRAPHSKDAIEIGEAVAELALDQGKSLLVFGSTDLTHYGPNYGFMPKGIGTESVKWVKETNDKGFIDRTLAMDANAMLTHAAENQSACSAGGASAAVAACAVMGSPKGLLADYYTSHDIMPGSSFVGYAGILF